MRCADFHRRMNELLDRRQPPERDRRLLTHAQNCRDCHELLWLGVEVFDRFGPGSRTPGGSDWHLPRAWSMRSAAAACVLALVIASVGWLAAQIARTGPQISASPAPVRVNATETANLVRRWESVPSLELGGHESQGGHRAVWAVGAPLSWPLTVGCFELAWQDFGPHVESARLRSWLQPVEGGLAPLAHSLNSALRVLRASWPLQGDEAERVLRHSAASMPLNSAGIAQAS